MNEFIKGMDVSTLIEERELGARFYDEGVEGNALEILKRYGANSLRIRLWNHPYTLNGKAYGAGTNDLEKLVKLATEGKKLGYNYLLDLHYSDFWGDPGKQYLPKAWEGLGSEELVQKVYEYTRDVLLALKSKELLPKMVQVGNEITNGIMWPHGRWEEHHETLAIFISAGIRAVREYSPESIVMLHLDCGGNNERCREWFDTYLADGGADFDVIGLSYYPFWHGTLKDLSDNMNDLAVRYQKDIYVAEVSMGFTMKDYKEYEKLSDNERKGMATKPHLAEAVEYPMTPKGQADFMQEIMERIKQVPQGRGRGFYYWEPAWIPLPGCGWANEYSLEYMKDAGPGGNEWANQALFDYDGNTLPALQTIKEFI